MKNLFCGILFFLVFVSCKEEKDRELVYSEDYVESLFSNAYDVKIPRKERLKSINQAYYILQDRENDSLKRALYFQLAGGFYNLEKYDKYFEVCKEVNTMSIEKNDTISISKSLNFLGNYYYIHFRNDSAYYYYTKAEKMYQHNKQEGATTDRIGLYKANILFYEKDFSGAETAVVKILKSAIKGSDTRLVYDCYITLGLSLEGLNQNDQALVYYNKAFELIEKMRTDPQYASLKAQTYNYIGKIYQKINDHSKAINYFNEALRFETEKTLLYANLMNNIGYSNFILENNNSLYYLNEAFQIRDSLQNIPGLVSSNINLSRYYLAQKDSATALQYCLSAKKKAHENKIFEDELIALKLLSKITPNKSLEYTKQYINLNDSLQNIERATRNKFARIEFETDEILNEKNTIEAEKEKISSQRWLILFSSIIAIVILVLIYITRMQHAKNKELQLERKQQEANEEIYRLMLAQQSVINEARQGEKKRISQELHDGVMSKLTSTRLNLFILSKKQDPETIQKCLKHIDGIQEIEKEIRNISHDLNKDALLEKDSFQAIVGNLFEEYKNTTGLAYQIEMDEKINWKKIDNTIKIHLYRIFQEALQNIYKYASATEVILDVVKADESILIEINDNGQGFDVAKMREGIGLKNMQSRIKTINGNFTIESVIGKGTSIKITIPA